MSDPVGLAPATNRVGEIETRGTAFLPVGDRKTICLPVWASVYKHPIHHSLNTKEACIDRAENPHCVAWYNSQIGNPVAPISGVILAVTLEAEPVPIALVAVTMQVYAVSLVSPLIVMGESVLVPL